MNPILESFIRELRTLGLDLEYRGGDQIYAVGNTGVIDHTLREVIRGVKPRVIAYLKPLYEQGDGTPVRLPATTKQDVA